jgi:hypothetical protein
MEQLMNLSALNMVSEVELIYKNKVKLSERPLVKSAKECYELLKLIPGNYQISLFDDTEETISLYQAIDSVKKRFGEGLLIRAAGASHR